MEVKKRTQGRRGGSRTAATSKMELFVIIVKGFSFYSKTLLNLYFTAAIKRESVTTSLRDIFQAYLWCLSRFCKIFHENFGAPNWIYVWFYNSEAAINNYPLRTRNFFSLAVSVSFLMFYKPCLHRHSVTYIPHTKSLHLDNLNWKIQIKLITFSVTLWKPEIKGKNTLHSTNTNYKNFLFISNI